MAVQHALGDTGLGGDGPTGQRGAAIAQQDAIITQTISGEAAATSDQTSAIDQASVEPVDTDTASSDGTDATAAAVGTTAAPIEPVAPTQPVEAPDDSAAAPTEPAAEGEADASASTPPQ